MICNKTTLKDTSKHSGGATFVQGKVKQSCKNAFPWIEHTIPISFDLVLSCCDDYGAIHFNYAYLDSSYKIEHDLNIKKPGTHQF